MTLTSSARKAVTSIALVQPDMFHPASRCLLRSTRSSLSPARRRATQRFLSTAPPHQKSRSWKSSAARWGVAIAGIYYYNTSELFAEPPLDYHLDPKADHDTGNAPTLDVVIQSARDSKMKQRSVLASTVTGDKDRSAADAPLISESEPLNTPASNPAGLEDEASSEGAFNPATGEINWDCPCLGGMAHGPCGEEFRTAFSCFVFSEEEPKGMDCIDKFKGMQECFRAHPDVYAAELEGDDDPEIDEALEEERQGLVREIKERREKAGTASAEPTPVPGKRLLEDDPPVERKPLLRKAHTPPFASTPPPSSPPPSSETHAPISEDHAGDAKGEGKALPTKRQPESRPNKEARTEVFDEDLELMPKEWHDSRSGTKTTER